MIRTQPWTGGTDEEYETQHFGFGTQRLKISLRQMVEQKVITVVKEMENNLHEKLNSNETDKAVLTHSCDKLVRLYCERAEPSLEEIDKEINKIMKVSSHVLLPEDEVQLYQATSEELEKLKEEVTNLRKQVERGALMEALLSGEEEAIASIENFCETAKKDMEVLELFHKNVESSEGLKKIQNEADFVCASVPFMKQNKEDIF